MDRHEKWVKVEPGTTIPAGQPYRIEYANSNGRWDAHEFSSLDDFPRKMLGVDAGDVFVDSSWRPPLNLPTGTMNWGIVIPFEGEPVVGAWGLTEFGNLGRHDRSGGFTRSQILGFVLLTDEQVARIEAAR